MKRCFKRPAPGAAGWLALGLVVAIAEVRDSRTMSDAFLAATRTPVTGPIITASYAILTAHLFGLLPKRYDPFHQFAIRTFARNRVYPCTITHP